MLKRPLREEQAAMRKRWSVPEYSWANDSSIRRKYDRRYKLPLPASVSSARSKTEPGTQPESQRASEEGQGTK